MRSSDENIKRTQRDAGFSLIELMVTVAIVGCLAATAIPNFQRFVAQSRQAEAKSALSAMYTVEKAYQADTQIYTECLWEAGYQPPGEAIRYYATGFFLLSATDAALQSDQTAGQTCNFGSISWGDGMRNDGIFPSNSAASQAGCYGSLLTPVTVTSFTLEAVGNVSNSGYCDIWTIDDTNKLTNAQNGL